MPLLEIRQGEKNFRIETLAGKKLLDSIWLSGRIDSPPVCAGLALCGRCKVRFLEKAPEPVGEDMQYFSPAELASGWRLACHHRAPDEPVIQLELPTCSSSVSSIKIMEKDAEAFLGIDLGTTSIQWRAEGKNGNTLAEGSLPNPQQGSGADVISRLARARDEQGRLLLASLIFDAIGRVVSALDQANLPVRRICIAGNSALTEILLQKDISGLCAAPYRLSWHGGEILPLEIGGASIPVVFPPLAAPFVGGDISAGILALIRENLERPFLLLDLGTNAEFALLLPDDELYLASAPLGPAMEGIGPRCGQQAGPGVISSFVLSPSGIKPSGISDSAGISATGYLSLLALLLQTGLIDAQGHFCLGANHPLGHIISSQIDGDILRLTPSLFLHKEDIEILLKVKAACSAVLESLLSAANIPAISIANVALAGTLGQYANYRDLAILGFLPFPLASKSFAAGNTSLGGACILSRKPEENALLRRLCYNSHIIESFQDDKFYRKYIEHMSWGFNVA